MFTAWTRIYWWTKGQKFWGNASPQKNPTRTHNKLPNCSFRLFSPCGLAAVGRRGHAWSTWCFALVSLFYVLNFCKSCLFCNHASKKDSMTNKQRCGQTGTNWLFMLVKISSILQEEGQRGAFFSPSLAFGKRMKSESRWICSSGGSLAKKHKG